MAMPNSRLFSRLRQIARTYSVAKCGEFSFSSLIRERLINFDFWLLDHNLIGQNGFLRLKCAIFAARGRRSGRGV